MKTVLVRAFSTVLTSPATRALRRALNRRGGAPVVDYFHQVDDPYSHLLVQLLPVLQARYGVKVRAWLVPPPDDAAAPERERLRHYAVRDAVRLAREYGLTFPGNAGLPGPEAVSATAAALAPVLRDEDFAARALQLGEALWRGDTAPAQGDATAILAQGEAERRRLGHYLSGMLNFEGEWYWGVDRLHHLEERLASRGFDTWPAGAPAIAPYRDMRLDGPRAGQVKPLIEFWFSFRSPYSWIAFPRVVRLAEHYGAELKLRYILPMVMRGLPVPRVKSFYIMLDTKREAERVDLRYGTMVDPVGVGVEKALAVLHRAVQIGKGEVFAEHALRGAFAEGVDLANDRAFHKLARRAGLTDAFVDAALADESWRIPAEENRLALLDAGLWGAPTYRVNGGPAHWGQDRLWALEQDLKDAIAAG